MNSIRELVWFEYRKIIKKRSNIITLLLAIFLTVFSCVGPLMGNYYIKGEIFESNYDSMKKDREYMRNISGREINDELISETIEAYSYIPYTDGNYSYTQEYQKYARPYSDIYHIIRRTYNTSGLEELSLLTREDINNLYSIRQNMVENNIENTTMSLKEKTNSIGISKDVKIPFTYSYTGGYSRFFSLMYTTAFIICFVCSICISPLFAGEHSDKMNSLILSSKYGKSKLIYAKIFTGITFSILLSIVLTVVSYITTMIFWGLDGGNSPIQLFLPLSIQLFTMKQAALLYFIIILFGNMLSATLTMLLSSKSKSPFIVIVIMTVITVIPMFVNISEEILWIYHLSKLIPINMFYFSNITNLFSIDLFGLIVRPYEVIIVFAIIFSMMLLPFVYMNFKNND